MILLQRFYSAFTTITILYRFNSLYSCNSSSQRCDVAYFVFQTHLADCFSVFCVVSLCFWCVDYKANFLVHNTAGQGTLTLEALTQPFFWVAKALSTRNQIYNIRTAATDFVYNFAFNSVCVVEVGSSLSAYKSKSQIF